MVEVSIAQLLSKEQRKEIQVYINSDVVLASLDTPGVEVVDVF